VAPRIGRWHNSERFGRYFDTLASRSGGDPVIAQDNTEGAPRFG